MVLYLRRAAATSAALKQADADLKVEAERIAALEKAAAAARAARAKELDEKLENTVSAGDAVDLLRGAFPGGRDSKAVRGPAGPGAPGA